MQTQESGSGFCGVLCINQERVCVVCIIVYLCITFGRRRVYEADKDSK